MLTCFTRLSCGYFLLFWTWKAIDLNEWKRHHHVPPFWLTNLRVFGFFFLPRRKDFDFLTHELIATSSWFFEVHLTVYTMLIFPTAMKRHLIVTRQTTAAVHHGFLTMENSNFLNAGHWWLVFGADAIQRLQLHSSQVELCCSTLQPGFIYTPGGSQTAPFSPVADRIPTQLRITSSPRIWNVLLYKITQTALQLKLVISKCQPSS